MATNHNLLGYRPGGSVLYQLSGSSKLLFFILVSISAMVTYDTRVLLLIAFLGFLIFQMSGIKLREVRFVLRFIGIFALLNLVTVYLFSPEYGVTLYGTRQVLWEGWGRFTLTAEQLFYLCNLGIKYFCTVPLAIVFMMTTHPSQLAASLHQLGLSYKVAYAVSLSLRYIPDLQEEFFLIRKSQEARGLELSQKATLRQRIKGNLQIVLPLIFSSLNRIETISTAMELRRFGKNKSRTWYMSQSWSSLDQLVLAVGLLILALTVALMVYNGSRFYNPFV
ncbi:energy-coupling factor transporter transmembrane component T family protein [Streptococcus ovuberis]|uniref:Energy-coupling factor transporter transmembrane protein EcfT n=1 Tax=Streptococcus ovuberis TaxID=1936207 RepID=A0A7X6MVV6_9STRE|nr:energy-coupling factor transporter transmembrane component T [Streptococcus ovuberis]NKZ19362.1 energy-coupling factor transporter transmembrane protein EcfT [Streptococcus ovuberis]